MCQHAFCLEKSRVRFRSPTRTQLRQRKINKSKPSRQPTLGSPNTPSNPNSAGEVIRWRWMLPENGFAFNRHWAATASVSTAKHVEHMARQIRIYAHIYSPSLARTRARPPESNRPMMADIHGTTCSDRRRGLRRGQDRSNHPLRGNQERRPRRREIRPQDSHSGGGLARLACTASHHRATREN